MDDTAILHQALFCAAETDAPNRPMHIHAYAFE